LDYDFDIENGNINQQRTIINVPREGFPDGMTIDNEENAIGFSQLAEVGKLRVWNPKTGEKIAAIRLPGF